MILRRRGHVAILAKLFMRVAIVTLCLKDIYSITPMDFLPYKVMCLRLFIFPPLLVAGLAHSIHAFSGMACITILHGRIHDTIVLFCLCLPFMAFLTSYPCLKMLFMLKFIILEG
jgi:hypothetical protein